jgi:hypothetical protein
MCVLLVEKQITLAALFFNGNLRRAFGIVDAVQAVNLQTTNNSSAGTPDPRAFEAASPGGKGSRREGVRPER